MHTLPRGNSRMNFDKRCHGMTLVELAVGLSVLSICSVLTIGTIVKTYEVITSVSDIRELLEEGQSALKRITAEMQDAQSIAFVGQTGIRIYKAHASSDGFMRVRFYKNGSVLYREGEPAGIARVLAQNVSEFEVTMDEISSNIFTIRLTMLDSGGEEHQLRADAYPMNLQSVSTKSFYNSGTSSGDWAMVVSGY